MKIDVIGVDKASTDPAAQSVPFVRRVPQTSDVRNTKSFLVLPDWIAFRDRGHDSASLLWDLGVNFLIIIRGPHYRGSWPVIQGGAEPTDTFQMVIDNVWKEGKICETVYKYVQVCYLLPTDYKFIFWKLQADGLRLHQCIVAGLSGSCRTRASVGPHQ